MLCIAFMIPLAVLNIRGSKIVGETSAALTIVIIAPFAILTVIGLWHMATTAWVDPLHPAVLSGQSKVSAFSAGLAVVIWNYVGFDSISTAGDEIVEPKRNYPLALAVSVPLIMMSYLLPMLAALASGLHHNHPGLWTDGDFALAGQLLGGQWLKVLIIIGAGVANVGLFTSLLLSGSRVAAVLAADRYLPTSLARTHPRFGTPVNAIVVSCLVFAVFCALDFQTLLDADIILGFGGLALEFAALLVLRKRFPAMVRPFRVPGGWPVAILITVLPLALCGGILWSTWTSEPLAVWLGVGGFALSAVLYLPCRWWIKLGSPTRWSTSVRSTSAPASTPPGCSSPGRAWPSSEGPGSAFGRERLARADDLHDPGGGDPELHHLGAGQGIDHQATDGLDVAGSGRGRAPPDRRR